MPQWADAAAALHRNLRFCGVPKLDRRKSNDRRRSAAESHESIVCQEADQNQPRHRGYTVWKALHRGRASRRKTLAITGAAAASPATLHDKALPGETVDAPCGKCRSEYQES
jgi:hypothetical protein